MEPVGGFKKGILIVGNFPSAIDDAKGVPFRDRYAQHLATTLWNDYGIDMSEDCMTTNAIKCHPGVEPTDYHYSCCRKYLMKTIKKYQPTLILTLGMSPLEGLLYGRWQKDLGGMEKWRGWTIPDQDLEAWVCPVYDPEYVLSKKAQEIETIWKQDLSRAMALVDKRVPKTKKATIEIIDDLSILSKIDNGQLVAIDYETTGLKPHGAGHRIVCASVATGPNHAYAFMMPETKKGRKPFVNMLANGLISKTAQNMKFEHAWSTHRLKQPVHGWVWDTMLASHLLDNRAGITGLKFQTYVRFGIVDYDSEIAPYLHAKDNKNGNALNRIEELLTIPNGPEKLMTYCGYDTIYEYRLMLLQTKIMNYSFLPF